MMIVHVGFKCHHLDENSIALIVSTGAVCYHNPVGVSNFWPYG